MRHNKFGEPRPKNFGEMATAMELRGATADDHNAEVTFEENDDGFGGIGWVAEVRNDVTGETAFITLAYDDQDKLIADLVALGFGKHAIEVYDPSEYDGE